MEVEQKLSSELWKLMAITKDRKNGKMLYCTCPVERDLAGSEKWYVDMTLCTISMDC